MALCLRTTVLLVVLVHGYHTLDWTSGPQNGANLYACVGDDVIMPWTYALATGDAVDNIQWFYQGQSQEVIATFSHGAFSPLPAFANRVQPVGNGGLKISHVTQADSGNYSVEITAADISNNHISLQNHLTLEITDDLMTSDRQLHVTMNPIPVLDNATNTYSIELQCGHFLFQQQPPVDVKWLTPSGSLHGSSQFKDGQFSFLLPLQAEGGNYTCRVSAGTCVGRDVDASVLVDAMDIRLALMEARLQGQLNATMAKLTAADIERKQLQDQLNATTIELADINERNSLVVSFHVGHLSSLYTFDVDDHVILLTLFTNQGNGYNKTSGIFTAPVNGTYCFIASTGTMSNSNRAGFFIMQGGSTVGSASAYGGWSWEMATGHAVVHLVAGDTVWLKATDIGEHYWSDVTWFSGVLISPDPRTQENEDL